MALNLEKQLLFYGAYHHDPTNVMIHMICVPILLATGLLLATNTPLLLPLPEYLTIPYLPPDLGTITALVYSSLYILMEPVAGTILAPFIIASTAFSHYLISTYGSQTTNTYALGLHIISWLAQFVGHGKFEGRAPALLDNLFQAIFLAPLFVWLEFLFGLGYRPELQARLEVNVAKELKALKEKKEKESKTSGKAQ